MEEPHWLTFHVLPPLRLLLQGLLTIVVVPVNFHLWLRPSRRLWSEQWPGWRTSNWGGGFGLFLETHFGPGCEMGRHTDRLMISLYALVIIIPVSYLKIRHYWFQLSLRPRRRKCRDYWLGVKRREQRDQTKSILIVKTSGGAVGSATRGGGSEGG